MILALIEALCKTNILLLTDLGEFFLQFGDTALHTAAKNDDHQVVELLVAAGADVNAQDSVSLTKAFSFITLSFPLHCAIQTHSAPTSLIVKFGLRVLMETWCEDRN